MLLRPSVYALALLATTLLLGCGTDTPYQSAELVGTRPGPAAQPTICPNAPGAISGPLVFAENGNLLAVGLDGSGLQEVTSLADTSRAQEPAWSPDGQTLVFTLYVKDTEVSWLPLTAICAIERSTGKGRTLTTGRDHQEGLSNPTWTADGQALLLTVSHHRLNDKDQYRGSRTEIARYDFQSGQITPLIEDSSNPVLSPDGKRLAYIHSSPTTNVVRLMLAQSDGKQAKAVASQQESFTAPTMPAWSPDSATLAFVARSGTAGSRGTPSIGRTLMDRLLGVSVAEAHGLSADVWVAGSDGQGVRQVTRQGFDDPQVAWSPDGKRFAVMTNSGGIRLISLDGGLEQEVTQRGNLGGIVWAAR